MRRGTKIKMAAGAMLAAVAIAGCGTSVSDATPDEPASNAYAGWIDTGDGRSVYCIFKGVSETRTMSCDWENARGTGPN